uniref:Recep_L_domain domain-containing protein n=1 Tax=Haemonchus contortus TaxID=6289 RepID=A0A7I4YX76_HAECO
MLFERAVDSEGTKKMRLAVLLICLMYGWAQEEVEEIIGAAEMAEIDAEFGGNASMMSNVTFTENGGNATTVPVATFTETGGSAVVVPPTTSPKDVDFDEVDKRKGKTFNELFRGMTVCKGHAHQTKIGSDKNRTRRTDCDVFVGHLWIDVKDETLPSRISRLRLVLGCITVMDSGLRELNFSLLSLLIYNERRCRPYVLRLVDNENLTSITFHENFTMPDSHLILFAGKHSLTEESITPRMKGYHLPKDSDDCRDKKRGCKVIYGDFSYSENDERLSTLERIEGRLVIHNTSLTNLSVFEKITVVGLHGPALKITDNSNLTDISSLYKMKIRGPEPVLKWYNNGALWCHNKADLKLLSRITQKKPYRLIILNWHGPTRVNDEFLNSLRKQCRCGCVVYGSLEIRDLDGETIDLTPLKNVYVIFGTLTITGNTRLYDLSFLENLNSIGNYSANITDIAFELNRNVDLFDAYMENLEKIHGEVQVRTCLKLPVRTEKFFKDLTQDKAIIRQETEGCTRELHEKETERERTVESRRWNISESEKSCFAGTDGQLTDLLRTQSYARIISIDPNLSEVFGYHTICEHFYGHLKVHNYERHGAIDLIQDRAIASLQGR